MSVGVVATNGDLVSVMLQFASITSGTFPPIAVVGNGPTSWAQKTEINEHKLIVRFNDANFMESTDRTTLHVVRKPSALSPKYAIHAPKWYVAPVASMVPNGALFTPTYEQQYGSRNAAGSDSAVFPGCNCGRSCLQSGTFAGASTGAVALSQLQQLPEVGIINVYGMNWQGSTSMHIDFKNSSIVRSCCTKCAFHATTSNYYGTGLTVVAVLFLVLMGAAVCITVTTGIGFELRFHQLRAREALPLLPLPVSEKETVAE
jgi:predicted membrane protein